MKCLRCDELATQHDCPRCHGTGVDPAGDVTIRRALMAITPRAGWEERIGMQGREACGMPVGLRGFACENRTGTCDHGMPESLRERFKVLP